MLIAYPGHSAARLEAGRAYFALRDYERAAPAFRAVLAAGPPQATRETAERYLQHIEGPPPRASRGFEAYVEASLGRDSNVNAAATADALFAPVAPATRDGDGFLGIGAGAALSHAIDRRYAVFGGADIRKRGHFDLDAFDFLSAGLRLGAQASVSERDLLRLTLEHEEYDRDYDSFRRTQGLTAQWLRRLERGTQVSAFAQALRIRYRPAAFASESSDMLLAGAQAARAFGSLRASASAYAGRDDATAGRADGDRALAGVGATLARRIGPRVEADVAWSYLRSDYTGSDREDRYCAIELGLLWRLTPVWTLRPQLSRAHNRSNLPFAEYGRTEVSVSLRRVWKD